MVRDRQTCDSRFTSNTLTSFNNVFTKPKNMMDNFQTHHFYCSSIGMSNIRLDAYCPDNLSFTLQSLQFLLALLVMSATFDLLWLVKLAVKVVVV